jgi:hypothetical protein
LNPVPIVTFVDCTALTATIRAGLPLGTHNLHVVNPGGERAILPNAFSVFDKPDYEELSLITGDLDGDGDDDIAGVNANGKIWYTTNLNTWNNIPLP